MLSELWAVIVAAMLPISELRGSIPLGVLVLKLDPFLVIAISIISNCLIFFPIFIGLELLYHRFFERFGWARGIIERIHRKGKPVIDKYGVIGLAILVGVPLPVTGAWTGTGIAWLLGLSWKKSFLAICIGVLIAAAIVSPLVLLSGMVI